MADASSAARYQHRRRREGRPAARPSSAGPHPLPGMPCGPEQSEAATAGDRGQQQQCERHERQRHRAAGRQAQQHCDTGEIHRRDQRLESGVDRRVLRSARLHAEQRTHLAIAEKKRARCEQRQQPEREQHDDEVADTSRYEQRTAQVARSAQAGRQRCQHESGDPAADRRAGVDDEVDDRPGAPRKAGLQRLDAEVRQRQQQAGDAPRRRRSRGASADQRGRCPMTGTVMTGAPETVRRPGGRGRRAGPRRGSGAAAIPAHGAAIAGGARMPGCLPGSGGAVSRPRSCLARVHRTCAGTEAGPGIGG